MTFHYSLEEQITEGTVQIIRDFRVIFDRIAITFENIATEQTKILHFSRVIGLSIEALCGVDYENDMDIMAYRTLIGLTVDKLEKLYVYEMIIDDYIVHIKCLNPASLDNAA